MYVDEVTTGRPTQKSCRNGAYSFHIIVRPVIFCVGVGKGHNGYDFKKKASSLEICKVLREFSRVWSMSVKYFESVGAKM